MTLGGGLIFLQDVFVSVVEGGTDEGDGGGGGEQLPNENILRHKMHLEKSLKGR